MIMQLAHKLGWQVGETRVAVREFLEFHSIVDLKKFLRICAHASNPQVRWIDVVEFLFKSLHQGDLVKTISDWLFEPDPCFRALPVFNNIDLKKKIGQQIVWDYTGGGKSFLNWAVFDRETDSELELKGWRIDQRLDYRQLCYEFLDYLIVKKRGQVNVASLLIDVMSNTGFLAFNINSFRELASWYCYNPNKAEKANELADALSDIFMQRTKITERQHWLSYALVESLIREKHVSNSTRAIDHVAKYLNKSEGATRREYYDKKKEAEEDYRNLDGIIKKFHLARVVGDFLGKVSI